jgi:hypothetical protein
MAYSNFTIEEVELKFNIQLQAQAFLPTIAPLAPSAFLSQHLEHGLRLVKRSASEKAKSEFLIAPILMELESLLSEKISLFSGEDFTVDRSLGLNGICDFLISQVPAQLTIKAPVIAIVEAKKGVLKDGWGQPATQDSEEASEQSVAVCMAELVAAQRFNQQRGQEISAIYGIVTSGLLWQFMKLERQMITIEPDEVALQPIDQLLGILHWLAQN